MFARCSLVAAMMALVTTSVADVQSQPWYGPPYAGYGPMGPYQQWYLGSTDFYTGGVIGAADPLWLLERPPLGYEVIPTGPNGYIYRPFFPQPGTPYVAAPWPSPPPVQVIETYPGTTTATYTAPTVLTPRSPTARAF